MMGLERSDQGAKGVVGNIYRRAQPLTFSMHNLRKVGEKSEGLEKCRKQEAQPPVTSVRDGKRAREQRGGLGIIVNRE